MKSEESISKIMLVAFTSLGITMIYTLWVTEFLGKIIPDPSLPQLIFFIIPMSLISAIGILIITSYIITLAIYDKKSR